jgi:Flp pilus assembly protein TadG
VDGFLRLRFCIGEVSMMKNERTLCALAHSKTGNIALRGTDRTPGPRKGRGRRGPLGWGEDGSTVVETAIVLPILLVVLTGIFSFGIILNQYLVLTNAINGGARAFAMSEQPSTNESMMASADPCAGTATIIQQSASNLSASNLSYTITYTVNKTGTATPYRGTGTSPPSCAGLVMNQYDTVQVQAVYPVTPVMYGWASKTLSLTAQSTELVQ